jgi:hypothetical protein
VRALLCDISSVSVAAPDVDAVTLLRSDVDELREDVDKLMEGKTT